MVFFKIAGKGAAHVYAPQLLSQLSEQFIRRLTEVSSEIMNVPQKFFITTIKELPDSNVGIGGRTIDKVKEEYRKTMKTY